MFRWFRKEKEIDLKSRLKAVSVVKVSGVLFHIRKIQLLDYLEGARVLYEIFSEYKTKDQKLLDDKLVKNINKAKDYMKDVMMAGVVKPKLVRKQEDDPDAVLVDDLFDDWIMVQSLVQEILDLTYGKKKYNPPKCRDSNSPN